MTSTAKAELGGPFINACKAVYIQQILQELEHQQPRTPVQMDNSTEEGIINNKIYPRPRKLWTCAFIG